MDQAMNNGYRVIRLLGFIGWDQPGWPDTASIVEFERRVNAVVRAYPAVVVCTYDLANLGGLSVMEGGLGTIRSRSWGPGSCATTRSTWLPSARLGQATGRIRPSGMTRVVFFS
jgi:hypothetical protein